MRLPRLTSEEKTELWARSRAGESLSDIARALRRVPGTVFHVVRGRGGIAPTPRRRSRLALSAQDRKEISRGLVRGDSFRALGRQLGRAPSTISREVQRHGGCLAYRAGHADVEAWRRAPEALPLASCATSSSPRRRKVGGGLVTTADRRMAQVSHPQEPAMHVSHETIYRSLFVPHRRVLSRTLLKHLRRRRIMRRCRRATTAGQRRGQIIDAISIHRRPAGVESRAEPGHWEGDLLTGARNSHVATLVERQTRFVLLIRLRGKDAESVRRALTHAVMALPARANDHVDMGSRTELAGHARFTTATAVPSTSVTRRGLGSVARMRIPTACFASISRRHGSLRVLAATTTRHLSSSQRSASTGFGLPDTG